MKDVARHAGVSVGTVSNVLNGRTSVAVEIRERVQASMRALDYVPNPTAQALRTGVSPLVGVAVLDLANPFFMEAATGMDRRFSEENVVMALSSSLSDPSRESRLIRAFAAQGMRGILLTPADDNLKAAREVAFQGTPVVLFDFPGSDSAMSSICVDDRAGAALAIQHLVELGHRHIGFLNGPSSVRQSKDRLSGVVTAVEASQDNIELTNVELDAFTAEAGRRGMQQLLESHHIIVQDSEGKFKRANDFSPSLSMTFPTAFFCANDLLAFGAMTTLRDYGIRVPEEVSLVGFDDISIAQQMSTPLTTVAQPMEELGWAAADLLLRSPTVTRHEKFYPSLVTRESTTGPRR
ncbi:MAG: LacI family DNA-binding transcriptional regulator [Actinomyces sp.]|nr:LacI family DNA-binding transcriptional regulator [Actinomyces sp.]